MEPTIFLKYYLVYYSLVPRKKTAQSKIRALTRLNAYLGA